MRSASDATETPDRRRPALVVATGNANKFREIRAILDGAPTADLWGYIVPLLVMGVIGLPLGVWAFRQAETYAKKHGKLKRVG
jgi:inosine/xanthosine triphosphate pyrophosphatase family protein